MASLFSKALVYLGLVDEEAVGAEHDDSQPPRRPAPAPERPVREPVVERPVRSQPSPPPVTNVRPIGQVEGRRVEPSMAAARTIAYRPDEAGRGGVQADIVVVEEYADARLLADRVRDRIPVILDLRLCRADLTRRVIDFSSGLVYALDGTMAKVGEGLVLVSPPRVSLDEREKERLRLLGAYELDS